VAKLLGGHAGMAAFFYSAYIAFPTVLRRPTMSIILPYSLFLYKPAKVGKEYIRGY